MKNKKINEINKIEEEQIFECDTNEIPPSDIVAFNELRSCADLLRMYLDKQLDVQSAFQREIVWEKPAQTRFIDSLSKQLPIPSMCIGLDYKAEKRIIIDGLQRMTSIINFLSNDEWELSALDDIDSRLSGKSVFTIKTDASEVYTRIQNVVIPITVIRCDFSKQEHNEYLFTIFHRLNSGGIKLNNQEIRNCIYNGKLNSLLRDLSESSECKKILGTKSRFSNEELILRFFAFYDGIQDYKGRLAKFLNDYMYENRNPESQFIENKKTLLNESLNLVNKRILINKNAAHFSKTFIESLLIGVAKNIASLKLLTDNNLTDKFNIFSSIPELNSENLREGLSSKEKVNQRINASISAFR